MTYKVYWRPVNDDIARWAIFSEKEDAENYKRFQLDRGATAWVLEIPPSESPLVERIPPSRILYRSKGEKLRDEL